LPYWLRTAHWPRQAALSLYDMRSWHLNGAPQGIDA
jgi:hypothetical protein